MALQQLSVSLKERKESQRLEGVVAEGIRQAEHARREFMEVQHGAVTKTEAAGCHPAVHLIAQGLERLEIDVAELRCRLQSEVQSLREALAVMAEAVRAAAEPVLEASSERCGVEVVERIGSEVACLRSEMTELVELLPLRAQKVELSDLVATKAKLRILALERDSTELRRRCTAVDEAAESRQCTMDTNFGRFEQEVCERLSAIGADSAERVLRAEAQCHTRVQAAMCEARDAASAVAAREVTRVSELWQQELCHETETRRKSVSTALQDTEVAASSVEASVGAVQRRVDEVQRNVEANLVGLRASVEEVISAQRKEIEHTLKSEKTELARSVSQLEAHLAETSATHQREVRSMCGEIRSNAHSALNSAAEDIRAEVAAERRHRVASTEEVVGRLQVHEHSVASESDARASAMRRISEATASSEEKRHRDDRAMWAKLHEISSFIHDKLPVEQREALAFAQAGAAEELRRELCAGLDVQSQSLRVDLKRELSKAIEEQVKRALLGVDSRTEQCVEGLEAAQKRQETSTMLGAEIRCEAIAHAVGRESEQRYDELKQSASCTRRALDELRGQLHEFMDEQRLFCGFLDTEQRSYKDLVRQEVAALSRLVDSSLGTDSARSALSSVRGGILR